jgi:hypothetical protein
MSYYREQIAASIRATHFHSATAFSWFGKLSPRLPLAAKRAFTPQTSRSYLLYNLQFQLYSDLYCRGYAAPARLEGVGIPAIGITPFVEELSMANCGSGCWEDGWELRGVAGNRVIAYGKGLELRAESENCSVPLDSFADISSLAKLRFPKEMLNLSPGYYMALGNKALTDGDTLSLLRLYWNLSAEGAVHFMRTATRELNKGQVAFKLKILNDPAGYVRRDAAVLYIRIRDYHTARQILQSVYWEVADYLKPGIPMFTKQLAAGVGLAEDPGQGQSFGLHRCQLLADGMIRANEHNKKSVNQRLRVVEDRFAEGGISLERPFLNPNSSDDYVFPVHRSHSAQPRRTSPTTSRYDQSVAASLMAATKIGHYLSEEAVWHEGRCNWLGAETTEYSHNVLRSKMTYRALGPDLYSGTSGVALFLAELYSITQDPSTRRTAIGAIRHTLSQVDSVPFDTRIGYFTGWLGMALAAVRIGDILGEPTLVHQTSQLLHRLVSEYSHGHEYDLLSGSAGAIAALVVLQELLSDALLLDFALKLADQLLLAADKSHAGYSWKSVALSKGRNLLGFSHGTAGVGYALLELFQLTRKLEYRNAAEEAFNYERHWFDVRAGNWPDLRDYPGQLKHYKGTAPFLTFWCHGAPGIAMSRLRAYQILNDTICKDEARTALQSTCTHVKAWLDSGTGNYSLCHGLAGNAEVLLYGYEVLGQEWAEAASLAATVAFAGVEDYEKGGHSWRCGTGGGETPALMLGLSGIGHFYLRLYNPTVPSILLLRRESFATGSRSSE